MKMLVWLVLIYVGFRIVKGFIAQRKEDAPKAEPEAEETRKDPVCGIYVSRDDAVIGNLEGEKIYFCSMECLHKFQEQLQHKNEASH
ncbi:YHS domain-containing protein [Geobacter sp. DSM 9736]|uniref:YHS domain-containing protein n=1 Tax=Geobacter sp. DSM 9736 TaxID=1277350 RepID=UPI000B500B48|nr:YHS domain-containing protein [Geobacter sp. DSM 9736]SNB47734.1 YHS domain-containing protein [Geobacter sp. DSM 9736]